MENIFEQGTRKKLRFQTTKGLISIEDLWGLPLESTTHDNFDLENVAAIVDAKMETSGKKKFTKASTGPDATEALKMAIIMHIIDFKNAANAEEADRAAKKSKRDKIIGLMANKQDEKDAGKSMKQLQKELDELDN